MKRIIISEIIKTDLAITSDKARYVFKLLSESIKNQEKVLLDFSGIRALTTAFLNIAIGELYRVENPNILNRYISFDQNTMSQLQKTRVKLVMENSREKLTKEEKEDIDEVILHG